MNAPAGVMEAEGTYEAPLHGWVCFHCGEEFSIAKQGCLESAIEAATEHFGPDPRWTPGCLELLKSRPAQLWRRLRRAEIALAESGNAAEELDYLQGVAQENHELRNRIDSLEGELAVERLRLMEAR